MFLVKILFLLFLMDFYDVKHTTQAFRDLETSHYRRPVMRRPAIRDTKPCPNPRFSHGRYRLKQKSKVIKFICLPGYSLVGNKYATCENGQWDEPTPVCVKPGCQLTPVENALNIPSYNDSWVVFFCLPGFEIVGSGTIFCDGNEWNGTLPTCVATKVAPMLSCDFETPEICGWKQDVKHDFDWKRLKGSTPSSFLNTGPKYDHTLGGNNGSSLEGYYMYIESTSRAKNQSARLISPIYDAELTKNGCFSFYYHMYGMSMGGLRVYQKPDSLSLLKMLVSPKEERDKYLLFEMWGNQMDFWYRSVTNLINISEDFQIVIEGIRGASFLSDIAIDDVAILQGENCTAAINSAMTPPPFIQSCEGRCNLSGALPPQDNNMLCGCTVNCFAESTCCPDFVELCFYGPYEIKSENSEDYTDPDPNTDDKPETQKLVALSTPVTTSTTTVKPTIPTRTTSTKITTQKLTTQSSTPFIRTSSKLVKTTNIITTKKITTTDIPTLVFKSTTRIYNATGILKKDNKTEEVKMKVVSTPVVTPVITTKLITTTAKPTTKVIRTTKTFDADERAKMEKERRIETGTLKVDMVDKKENKPTSGVNTAIAVIIGIALCACAAFLIHTARGARGREIIARVRGRIQSDPEVRYLSAHVDE